MKGNWDKAPRIGLHEAWAELFINDKWSVKTGRQELVYGNHRLLGNVGWAQQARSHDALLLKFAANDLRVDFGGAFNQVQENLTGTGYDLNNYKAMVYAYFAKKLDNVHTHVLFINDAVERDDPDADLSWKHTIGGGATFKKDKFGINAAVYWQGGKTPTEAKISALLSEIKLSMNLDPVSIAIGGDFVSGNKSGSDKYGAFNTLFGTNHKFYGLMDYYLNIPADTDGGGLQDYYLSLKYAPSSKIDVQLFYHHFFTASSVINPITPSENLNKNLGGELDAVFSHKINSYIKLNLGASMYFPTFTTEQIKGGSEDRVNGWAWTMIAFTPELFNSGKKDK